MPTVKCSYTGCDKSFYHENQMTAAAALRMHVGRKHTKAIKDHPQLGQKRQVKSPPLPLNGEEKMDKRSKAWRVANPDKIGQVVAARQGKARAVACFCPRCGLNLQMLNASMSVALKYT